MARKPNRTRSAWGTVRNRRGRWTAEYTGPDNARHRAGISFSDENSARAWLRDERRLMDLETWTPPATRRERAATATTTVGQWLDSFHDSLERRPNPPRVSTMQTYRRAVSLRITNPTGRGAYEPDVTRLAGLKLAKLTKQDVYRWWDGLQRAYTDGGQTTNQHAYKRLKAACAEAVRREIIPVNPVEVRDAARRIKPQEKYLPEDWEISAIIDAVPEQYQVITSLILHHGLRIGEALAVEREDVRLVARPEPGPWLPRVIVSVKRNVQRISGAGGSYMLVQPPKTTAGYRDVPVLPSDVPLFVKHLTRLGSSGPTTVQTHKGPRRVHLLTTTATGALMMDTSYRSVLNRAKEKAGVNMAINPHCGRNWLITRMAERGAQPKEIGRVLGQDDVSTVTNVYMKARESRTLELMDIVGNTLEGRNDG